MEKQFSGRTEKEALQKASEQLGIAVEELSYEIVEYPSKGFLGIGNKPAVIKIIQTQDPASMVEEYLSGMFNVMQISDYSIKAVADDENMTLDIQVDGDEVSVLQRKQGGAVEALQFLLALYVNKDRDKHYKVSLNINNFREKSQGKMTKVAEKAARQVLKNRRKMTLHPMSAYQRRMIHAALQDMENITTYSIGEEPNRRVVINYTGPDAVEYKPRNYNKNRNQNRGNSRYSGSGKYGRPTTSPRPFNPSENDMEKDPKAE